MAFYFPHGDSLRQIQSCNIKDKSLVNLPCWYSNITTEIVQIPSMDCWQRCGKWALGTHQICEYCLGSYIELPLFAANKDLNFRALNIFIPLIKNIHEIRHIFHLNGLSNIFRIILVFKWVGSHKHDKKSDSTGPYICKLH